MRSKSVAAGAALVLLLLIGLSRCGRHEASEKQLGERAVAARVLAESLAGLGAYDKALVIGNPFARKMGCPKAVEEVEQAELQGLSDGFGSQVDIKVVYPELTKEARRDPGCVAIPPGCSTPLSYMLTADAFDRIHREHPSYQLIVSLIGLPARIGEVDFWLKKDAPALALLLPELYMLGSRAEVADAFKSGHLAATVLERQDIRDAGDRYIVVTAQNIDEMLQRYPELF
ncbi:MAG: hypothetical protein KJ626_06340 [Verrucomicrobia bacterium]|nr:hypothetical protein [Verrucomicrobiota bacterium]